eukprot:m51a1_g9032 hypothetical protein (391) ;mRNA; f:228899-230437
MSVKDQLAELISFVSSAEEDVRIEALRRLLVASGQVDAEAVAPIAPAVAPLVSSALEPAPIRQLAIACLANSCLTNEAALDACKAASPLLSTLVDLLIMKRACAWAGCPNPQQKQLLRCSRCKSVWYCCKSCALLHWKAGHKNVCTWTASCTEQWSEEEMSHLAAMALVNLTRAEDNCRALAADSPNSVSEVMCAYAVPPPLRLRKHVAFVVTNLSQNAECRKKLLPMLSASKANYLDKDPEIRRSCFSTIRNLCFDKENHEMLLKEPNDVLSMLLVALRGRKELDEKDTKGMPEAAKAPRDRDSDLETRKIVLDSLVLLCTERNTREQLREKQVYPIVRDYDLEEEDAYCKGRIVDIVDFLIRDEEAPVQQAPKDTEESQSSGPVIEEI